MRPEPNTKYSTNIKIGKVVSDILTNQSNITSTELIENSANFLCDHLKKEVQPLNKDELNSNLEWIPEVIHEEIPEEIRKAINDLEEKKNSLLRLMPLNSEETCTPSQTKPDRIKREAATTLKNLLDDDASYKNLVRYFEDNSEGALERKNTEIRQLETSELQKLMSRSDKKGIFTKIAENNISLPENVLIKLLEIAAKNNDFEICRDHLLKFTEVNSRLFNNNIALTAAIENYNAEMLQLFLEKGAQTYLEGAKREFYPVHHAVMQTKHDKIIKILKILKKGDTKLINELDPRIGSPAHMAAAHGKIYALHSLIIHGEADIDIETTNARGRRIRPIHEAIANRESDTVIALIELGARVIRNPKDFLSESLLSLISKNNLPKAFEKCFTELKELELQNIDLCSKRKMENCFDDVQKILDKSASIAVEKNYLEMLKKTLELGAKTPTIHSKTSEEVKEIIEKHAPFNEVSRDIITAVKENLPLLSRDGERELLTLEGEIRAALIKTYSFDEKEISFNAEKMLKDFPLTKSNPVKYWSPFGQKHQITHEVGNIGEEIAQLLTHKPHVYSVYTLYHYHDIFISAGNRELVLEKFEDKANQKVPQTTIQRTEQKKITAGQLMRVAKGPVK